jgi:hypothetical protein
MLELKVSPKNIILKNLKVTYFQSKIVLGVTDKKKEGERGASA